MHRHLLPWSLLLTVCASPAVRAQGAAVPRGLTDVAGNALTRVLVDQPGDGTTWALARGYKAHFSTEGVDYIPYLGPKAPKNHPLAFRLRSVRVGATELPCTRAAAPVFERDRVSYDRGGVREVWELRAAEVEQTFVLAAGAAAGTGDLVVTIDVASELPCTEVEGGLAFAGGALGEVRYGNLLACDGQGRRFAGPARWTGNGVELRVPAAFLAAASGPITVDPIVRTIAIDAGTDDNVDPDVAYDPGSDRWLVVYERVFSQRDQDIIERRYTGAGDLLEEVAVATGSRESHRPAVAANSASKQFLVVWDEDAGIADRVVLGRFRDPRNTSQGSAFTVQDSVGNDQNADVGGSFATDGLSTAAFLVVCESGSTLAIMRVSSTGAVAVTNVNNPPSDVRVTKARTPGGGWLCVYRVGPVVHAFRVTTAGTVFARVVDNTGNNGPPEVAGSDADFLVVYRKQLASPTHGEVFGVQLRFANNALSVVSSVNLTAVERNAIRLSDHQNPVVSYDGFRFTYAYLEQTGAAANYEAFAATLLPGATPFFSDAHRPLHAATPGDLERNLAIASEGEMGGDAGRYFIAWDLEVSATSHDIQGVLFDGTAFKGGITTIPTSCGPHITILAENTPALGTTLRVRTDRIAPPSQLYLVGEATLPQTLCTQGCKLGVFSIFFVVPGAELDLPIPRDPNLMGVQFAVQNLVLASLGGCAPPSFALPLVTTDTLSVLIQ